jgi:hypothetical protein
MKTVPPSLSGTAAIAALAALLTAGCAGARVDGQWASPEFSDATLQGRTVLVSCRALDDTTRRICEDRLSARVAAAGARPVRAPEPAPGPQTGDDLPLAAARDAGAQALLRTTLMSSGSVVGGLRPSVGVGVGGGSGSFGIGGGISLPIGGTRATEAFTASTSVFDVATGRPMWSVRTSTSASSDIAGQVEQLTGATVDAMRGAGLL